MENITNYMKYDKRILYNSFKYIVVLEELFKSMIAKIRYIEKKISLQWILKQR